MLYAESVQKSQKTLTLWGDYFDLKNCYDVLMNFATSYPLESWQPQGTDEFVMDLCYEIRHAYQGDRLKKSHKKDESWTSLYFGMELFYPYFALQLGIVRRCIAFRPTSRWEISMIYLLESAFEDAMNEVDPSIADAVMGWMEMYEGISGALSVQEIRNEIFDRWCQSRQKDIFKTLPVILRDVNQTAGMRRIIANVEARALGRKSNKKTEE